MNNIFINSREDLIAAHKKYQENANGGYISGINCLDEIIRLTDSSLTVFVGAPGDGKTTFLNNWTYRLAKTCDLKTLFLSFEMPIGLHMDILLRLYGSVDEMLKYVSFRKIKAENTLDNIYETIKANVSLGTKIVVIDPFNMIESVDRDLGSVNDALRRIKNWCTEFHIAIILCHHCTKNAINHDVRNAAGSYLFNAICDNAMGLESDHELCKTTVHTYKIRYSGMNGKAHRNCTLYYDEDRMMFYDPETEGIQDEPFNPEQKEPEIERVDYDALMNREVSMFENAYAKQSSGEITLEEALTELADKDKVANIRKLYDDPNAYREAKCRQYAFTPSGKFSERKVEGLTAFTNIIAIDIDGKDNEGATVEEMLHKVSQLPFVFYASESISGRGIFALVNVDGTVEDFRSHFNALEKDFNAVGLNIDKSCKDVSRLRFASIGGHYSNKNAIVYKSKSEESLLAMPRKRPIVIISKDESQPIEPTRKLPRELTTDTQKLKHIVNDCINHGLQLTKNHADTLALASSIYTIVGAESDGFSMLCALRNIREGYDSDKLEQLWERTVERDEIRTNPIGTLVNLWRAAPQAA